MVVELPAVELQVRQRKRALARLRELLNALFLHGLAGRGREWDGMQRRVPARTPDLREHGTREEYVADAVELIGGRPVVLIGQSLGGHTAMLVAARHPRLVERLVLIEASPARDPDAPERVRNALRASPAPYGAELDPDAAAATVAEIAARGWWLEWQRVRCPVLVVRGEHGELSRELAEEMTGSRSAASFVEIADAGHDVHLDRPDALADAIEAFVQGSRPRTSSM
jgi:pimeloyl-ACP methyl ester carboxylesterase